jgi:hypothetical protein
VLRVGKSESDKLWNFSRALEEVSTCLRNNVLKIPLRIRIIADCRDEYPPD